MIQTTSKSSTHLPGETGRLSQNLRGGWRLVNIAGGRDCYTLSCRAGRKSTLFDNRQVERGDSDMHIIDVKGKGDVEPV